MKDISTRAARSVIIQGEIAKHLRAGSTYNSAFSAVKADPAMKSVWDAMRGPTRAAESDPDRSGMLLSAAVFCTANIALVSNDGWALIAPFGDHPAPDRSYVQRFDRTQSAKVVATWNSPTGMAARIFKNKAHNRDGSDSMPVWDGHPDSDRARWLHGKLLGEVTKLRTGSAGLEGLLSWNAKGMARRTRGPLYPSPLWWHLPPAGNPPTVFPEFLESVGLVPEGNISSAPAWTQNSGHALDETCFATANARCAALQRAVRRRMREESIDYDTAFARCFADPALAHITSAMRDPTRGTM